MICSRKLAFWAAVVYCVVSAESIIANDELSRDASSSSTYLPSSTIIALATSQPEVLLSYSNSIGSTTSSDPYLQLTTTQTSPVLGAPSKNGGAKSHKLPSSTELPRTSAAIWNISYSGVPGTTNSLAHETSSAFLQRNLSHTSMTSTILASSRNLTSVPTPMLRHHNVTSAELHTSTSHETSVVIYSGTKSLYSNWTTMTTAWQRTSQSCIPYTAGDDITVYSVVPNTHTVTVTIYQNQTNAYFSTTPEWNLPTTCLQQPQSSSVSTPKASTPAQPFSDGPAPIPFTRTFDRFPHVTTVIVSSKNPVVQFTTQVGPEFPGGNGQNRKLSVVPHMTSIATPSWSPISAGVAAPILSPNVEAGGQGGTPTSMGTGLGDQLEGVLPITVCVGGLTVILGPSVIAIGSVTVSLGSLGSYSYGSGSSSSGVSDGPGIFKPTGVSGTSGGSGGLLSEFEKIITQGGQTWTVNPSQVIGPGTIIPIPTDSVDGGLSVESPTPTLLNGISVAVGSNAAIVGGSTFAVGYGAPEETIAVSNENVSIGPGGVAIAGNTITSQAAVPTNAIVYDGQPYSVIGGSVAVLDGTSFTFTGGVPMTTVFNGETITAGPSGFVEGTSTLGGPNQLTETQYGLAGGMTISEIGSTLAVVDGTTLAVGPEASSTTLIIGNRTLTVEPLGLHIDGLNGGSTLLSYPFNPTTTTQEVTAGGVTYSAIGTSLVDIGGTTYTIGAGATPTSEVYNGQTLSIGPGGIGFATTTSVSLTHPTTKAALAATSKKSSGVVSRPLCSILGLCIVLGIVLFA